MLIKKNINLISRIPIHSPWLIALIFSFISLIGILNHSMWRDELNPWLIVRDSTSFRDLIANIHYEGHPVLWYFSLAFLRNIADTPIIMQLFHLSLTIISVTLFWLYSPFNYRQKFLFTFGFLPFYEYLLISRNYAFSMMFTFLFCTVFESRKKSYLKLAIILGLLANSNVYAFFVAFCLSLTLLVEFIFNKEQRQQYFIESKKYDFFLSFGILIFAFLLALYIIIPPTDSYLHGGLDGGWLIELNIRHLLRSIGRLFGAYFLIIPAHKRWLDLIVCALIALFVVGLTVLKLRKKPFPLFFYITGNSVILAFTYLRFIGNPRHFGHFYLVLLAALWLASYYQDSVCITEKLPFIKEKSLGFVEKWHHIALMVVLYIQFFGGIGSFTRDLIIPFSASRATIEYIQESHLENEFIVASRDANMAALSGYLNRKFYYPELQGMGSFTLFKEGRQSVDEPEIFRQISLIFQRKEAPNKILLILIKKLDFKPDHLKIMPIKSFERSWTDSERYYLYWISPNGES